MKKILKLEIQLLSTVLLVICLAACNKNDNGGITGAAVGTGAPVVTSVHTISQSKIDSSLTSTQIVYNSAGVPTTTTTPNYTPQITAFDSTTATGKLGNYYVLMGSNLGSTTSIVINGVSIYFNRALNSDKTVIFQLPTAVPYVQPQPNTIVVTTLYGKVTYAFTTLPPPPTIVAPSDYDFWSGTQITLAGKGFASVSAVKLRATGDALSIISQNDSTLVMQMPTTSAATESTLLFTYTSGANSAAQTASTATFNDLDNGYVIFNKNNFQNGWGDNSWAGPSGVQGSNPHEYGGTSSIEASYPSNGWKVEGWANWYPSFAYSASYKYLTFWVKGGTIAHTLVLVGDQMAGGYGQVQNSAAYAAQLITVPPGVWSFFKIPLAAPSTPFSQASTLLNYWANGTTAKQLGFFLQGSSSDPNETLYFDEVAFIQ